MASFSKFTTNRCFSHAPIDCRFCLVSRLCPTVLQPYGLQPTRFFCPWNFPGKNTGVGYHFLLQGIFPTQELNPGLLHCRQILYRLSYKGRSDSYLFLIIFPGGTSVKEHACMPANAEDSRDASLIPESGRSPGGGHGNPLQYFCLENP